MYTREEVTQRISLHLILKIIRLWLFSAFFLALILAPTYLNGGTPFRPHLDLKLSAGWGTIAIGDMNKILKSFNNMSTFQYYRINYPDLISGEIRTLSQSIADYFAEMQLELSPKVGLGLGISPHRYSKSSEGMIDWTMVEGQRHEFTIRPKIRVEPSLNFSVYYFLFSRPRLKGFLDVGLGLYEARIAKYYKLEVFPIDSDSDWGIWTWESEPRSTFGVHAGLEVDYMLTTKLSIIFKARQGFAWIRGFTGTRQDEGKYFGITYTETNTLYYYTRLESYTGDRYADIQVFNPPGSGIDFPDDIRKASLNLSGYSFQCGIKIRLF